MESSESHEPSYYEVALTNRQVLIAFVVLLTSIVVAFLSGVWIGRGSGSSTGTPPAARASATTPGEVPLEQLTFFSGKDAGTRGTASAAAATAAAAAPPPAAAETRPAPSGASGAPGVDAAPDDAAAEERATETLRQNLDATMAANRTVPAPAGTRAQTPTPAPAATPAKPPANPPAAASPTPAKATAAAKPAVAGKTFVQVYSSTNGTRAKEIVAQLKKAGFTVAMVETPKGKRASYRVRVGPYSERSKADAAAARLRREFRLETWVTDSP